MTNRKISFSVLLILTLLILVLAACGTNDDGAAKTVEAYITALSEQDVSTVSSLSCADWEANALLEVDSFTAVSSKVDQLDCSESGKEGDDVLVSCTGKLALDYGGEAQEIDLSSRTYLVRQEGADWRMCGYR
ncbi:MAG: hypothetical protein ACM3H7_03925 [Acidobacteriaceae bacterium]